MEEICKDIIIELKYYLEGQGDEYDYKSRFKTETEVKAIRTEVLRGYAKDKSRGRATVFQIKSSPKAGVKKKKAKRPAKKKAVTKKKLK